MLEFLEPHIKIQDIRAIPKYHQFLKAQSEFIKHRRQYLYDAQGHESEGIKLLRFILQFADMDYLERCANNYDRYRHHLRFIRRDMMNIFDRISRGRGYNNLFFQKSNFYTEEFLLPIEDINTIVNLPLHTENWNEWKFVRPFRIWAHDSDEFTVNILNDRVTFAEMPPSYTVELLDVIALVMKYFIWNKHQRHLEPAKDLAEFIPQQLFLHKYVMVPTMTDLTDIWLLSCLKKLIDVEDPSELKMFDSNILQSESQYGRVATSSRAGFESVWEIVSSTKKNLRPESLLSSKLLLNSSIHERILLAHNELNLPMYRQYDYLRWLRDKDLFSFYMKVWSSRPDMPTSMTIRRKVSQDFKRMIDRRPWNQIHNPALRLEIEADMRQNSYFV